MESNILVFLSVTAFFAGFIDAVVGGGGLIQTPIGLILMPNLPVATVIGTLKISSISGTTFASIQYLKKVAINWKFITIMMILATSSAFMGSMLLTVVKNDFMKPVLLVVLSLLLVYTFKNKKFGQQKTHHKTKKQQLIFAIILSIMIGFYDGFIGPGTGSFLVLGFIMLLGFDFLHASANAKMVNLATNFGSIVLFVSKGTIIWSVAIPMAICNALGGFIGAKVAIKEGNKFIRIFFIIIVVATLIRFGYDVFLKK